MIVLGGEDAHWLQHFSLKIDLVCLSAPSMRQCFRVDEAHTSGELRWQNKEIDYATLAGHSAARLAGGLCAFGPGKAKEFRRFRFR